MTEFKWNNRKKATETAIQLKSEGMTPEEAVKKVLADYEGVYFVNGSEISEKRYNNFIQRVEEEKKYKASKSDPIDAEITQVRIKELADKGELTDLQAVVLDTIFNALATYKVGLSDLTLADIAEYSQLKVDRAKGALGHLIKKKYVKTEENEVGGEKVTTIYIEPSKYGLYNDEVKPYHEAIAKEVDTEEADPQLENKEKVPPIEMS